MVRRTCWTAHERRLESCSGGAAYRIDHPWSDSGRECCRVRVELRLARLRAEIVGLPVVLALSRGLTRLDVHPTNNVSFHVVLLQSGYWFNAGTVPSFQRPPGAERPAAVGEQGR